MTDKHKDKINTHEHPVFGKGRYRIQSDAVNHELRRKLWEGQLPLKIDINEREVSTSKERRSIYLMVPRLNYFTFILQIVKDNFDDYVAADLIDNYPDMWFEYNKTSLRWDVPIGVQFDTLVGLGKDKHMSQNQAMMVNNDGDLPWHLVFHYKGNADEPSRIKLQKNGQLLGIKNIEFSFINSIKESHVLRMGSAHEILAQMKKYEEEKLLDGVQKHDYMQYWEINQPLNDKHIADMKKFAIKIYSNVYQNFVLPNLEIQPFIDEQNGNGEAIDKEEVQQTEKFIQWEQEKYDTTLGDYLLQAFPNLFEYDLEEEQIKQKKRFQIISHGLIISLDTPMYWLQLNMSYLDNFLYLSFYQPDV